MAEIDDTQPPEEDVSNVVVPFDKQNHTKPKKKFRKVVVKDSQDGQFYYVAQGRNNEPLYTSETFTQRSDAIRAARREHEGRSEKFDYILEYQTAKGSTVRETL